MRSPLLGKNIALCRMAVQHAEAGHRGRGGQARRPPEADPGDRRARSPSTTRRRSARAADERLKGVRPPSRCSAVRSAPADTLADEQRHLDLHLAGLRGRAARAGRRAGPRASTSCARGARAHAPRAAARSTRRAAGRCTSGGSTRRTGASCTSAATRSPTSDNDLLAINWRAPAAQPFYTATPADRHGVVRRRRLEIEERTVHGYVDETLAPGEGDEALTDAIVEDITRRRVGEMRQIISTITPEQYELIAETVEGPLVIQGGPGTGKTAVGLHRAAWLLYADPALQRTGVLVVGPNEVFIAYISQVLPSLGETNVEQRAAQTLAPARGLRIAEPTDVATLKGSGRMAALLERLLWDRVGAPDGARRGRRRPRHGRRRRRGRAAARRRGARPLPQPPGRPRALPRAARELDRHARAGGPPRRPRREPRGARDARAQDEGLPGAGDQGVAAGHRRPALRRALPATASGWPRRPRACSSRGRSTCSCAPARPPTGRCARATCRCSTRRAGSSTPTCARTATSSSTRRRTSRRWSCGWSCAARAASR